MIPNKYRRKLDLIQQDKENYARHINRLQSLKTSWSPSIKNKIRKEKQLHKNIIKVHKIHQQNRKHEISEQKRTNNTIKRLNANRIKSVVKAEFNREPSSIPSKHKPNNNHIKAENERIYEKIIKIQPKVNSHNEGYTDRPINNNHLPSIGQNILGLSRIYETSILHDFDTKKIKFKFGRKPSIKIRMKIDPYLILNALKEKSQLFLFQAKYGEISQRSQQFVLDQLLSQQIVLLVSKKYFRKQLALNLIRIFPQKELIKGVVTFEGEQFQNGSIVKDLTCQRGKKVSDVKIEVKIK